MDTSFPKLQKHCLDLSPFIEHHKDNIKQTYLFMYKLQPQIEIKI